MELPIRRVTHSSSTTPNSHPRLTSAASIPSTAMMMVPTAASVTRHERVAPSMISEHATAETAGEIRAV